MTQFGRSDPGFADFMKEVKAQHIAEAEADVDAVAQAPEEEDDDWKDKLNLPERDGRIKTEDVTNKKGERCVLCCLLLLLYSLLV